MLLRLTPSLAAAAVLVGAAAGQEPSSTGTESTPRPEPFALRWTTPSSAVVTHRRIRDARGSQPKRDVESRFVLDVTADDEDGVLQLVRKQHEIVRVNGVDASNPFLARAIAPLAAQLAASQPAIRVRTDGEFLGVEDWGEFMARAEAALNELAATGGLDPDAVDATRALMKNDTFRELSQQKSADPWNAWAGTWVGLELAAGAKVEETADLDIAGQTVPQKLVYEHLGDAADRPGHVRLRLTIDMSGPELATAMRGLLTELATAVPLPKDGDPDRDAKLEAAAATMQITTTVETVLDPQTLRPVVARIDKRMEGVVDGKRGVSNESERFEFDWRD